MMGALSAANQAFRKCQTTAAMAGYVDALIKMPEIARCIAGNILRTRQQYLKGRKSADQLKVVVCGWELAHNAAGRAHTLAEIYKEITGDVKIVGSIFQRWGSNIWEPLIDASIPINHFIAEEDIFIYQAMSIVAAHPADVVHLSKPRAPNIFYGIFYKIFWGAKVIIDIDDEELSFVKAYNSIELGEYILEFISPPPLNQITDKIWTQIAVGLVNMFDAITVSNAALQSRYGGRIIGHARDPKKFKKSRVLNESMRNELNIKFDQKVILFLGTPRPHKGIYNVARALQNISYKNVIFVIAGSFTEKYGKLKNDLKKLKGVNYRFIDNLPISEIFKLLSIADCTVLMQDKNNPTSAYQIPAKLSDALAVGITTFSTNTAALNQAILEGAVIEINENDISMKLENFFKNGIDSRQSMNASRFFEKYLSIESNKNNLVKLISICPNKVIDTAKIVEHGCNENIVKSLIC